MSQYKCAFCAVRLSLSELISHINQFHKHEKHQLYYCSYCDQILRTMYNYKKHLMNQHPDIHDVENTVTDNISGISGQLSLKSCEAVPSRIAATIEENNILGDDGMIGGVIDLNNKRCVLSKDESIHSFPYLTLSAAPKQLDANTILPHQLDIQKTHYVTALNTSSHKRLYPFTSQLDVSKPMHHSKDIHDSLISFNTLNGTDTEELTALPEKLRICNAIHFTSIAESLIESSSSQISTSDGCISSTSTSTTIHAFRNEISSIPPDSEIKEKFGGLTLSKFQNENEISLFEKTSAMRFPNRLDIDPSTTVKSEADVAFKKSVQLSEKIHHNIASFASKLYGNRKISRTHSNEIINDVSTLFKKITTDTLQPIPQCSKNCDSEISSMFKLSERAFTTFRTEHRSMKFFEEMGHFIPPQSKIITTVLTSKRMLRRRTITPIKIRISVIPLKKVLQKFFELPNVFSKTLEYVNQLENSTSEIIESPIQCQVWRTIRKNFQGKIVFPLLLSHDDLEISNPLGSHRGVHKLGATYIYLPCLPKEYSGELDNIFLAQLHNSKDGQKIGNKRIFADIIEQLKDLQLNGIKILVDGEIKQIYFSLLAITGDNLGLHQLLGFVTNFNVPCACRFCTSFKIARQRETTIHRRNLRTVKNYPSQLAAGTKGIVEKCIFNTIKYYHVIKNQSVDEHHDWLEGIFRRSIPKILERLIYKHKFFSLCTLNWCIKFFDYGSGYGANSPPPITEKSLKKSKLTITASEMKTLVRYLSLYIGHYVPVDCLEWKLYIIERKIYQIISSGVCSDMIISEYQSLIAQHHTLYQNLFEENFTPKFHWALQHYGSVMGQLGPVKFYSAMRPEGKHQTLKQTANSTKSRLNPAHTLSIKNQQQLSYRFSRAEGFSYNLSHSKRHKHLTSIKEYETLKLIIPNFPLTEGILVAWAKIYGTLYEVDMCITLQSGIFGRINYIVIDKASCNNKVFFFYKIMNTISFSEHLQAFEVTVSDEWGCINHKDLKAYKPLIMHVQKKKQYLLLI